MPQALQATWSETANGMQENSVKATHAWPSPCEGTQLFHGTRREGRVLKLGQSYEGVGQPNLEVMAEHLLVLVCGLQIVPLKA